MQADDLAGTVCGAGVAASARTTPLSGDGNTHNVGVRQDGPCVPVRGHAFARARCHWEGHAYVLVGKHVGIHVWHRVRRVLLFRMRDIGDEVWVSQKRRGVLCVGGMCGHGCMPPTPLVCAGGRRCT